MPEILSTIGNLISAARSLGIAGTSKRKKKICLFGSDASGKTTFLYRLKLGRAVTTIPTIGFNVEYVPWRVGCGGGEGGDGEKQKGTGEAWEFEIWDIGGCDKMAALMHHYVDPDSIVLFMHDCSDNETWRVDRSVELLHLHIEQMKMKGAEYMWVLLGKQDGIIGGEDERDRVVSGLRDRFAMELARYDGKWKEKEEGKRKEDRGESSGETGLKWWILAPEGLSGVTGDGTDIVMDEVCLALSGVLASGTTEHRKKDKGTTASPRPQDKPPTTAELHDLALEAMSDIQPADVFWSEFLDGTLSAWNHASHLQAGYIVLLDCMSRAQGVFESAEVFLGHLARLRERQPERFRNTAHVTMTVFWILQLHLAAATYQATTPVETFPSKDQFKEIVLHTPSLMDRSLWKVYYSKDLLFSPEARGEWHLPDLRPLPSTTTPRHFSAPLTQPPSGTMAQNADRLIEYAFVVVKKVMVENLRRGVVVKQALASLQRTTLQMRAKDPGVPAYSETQAYFWIQMAHVALHDFVHTGASTHEISVENLDFLTFKLLYGLNEDTTWRKHYSPRLWLEDITTRMQFVPPDLKPLPNIIKPDDESIRAARRLLLQTAAARVSEAETLPSREALAFIADRLVEELKITPLEPRIGDSDGQISVKVRVDSHAQLLNFLHTRLVLNKAGRESTREHPSQTWSGATSSSYAAATLDAVILGDQDSYTEKSFWTQQVLFAAAIATATTTGSLSPPQPTTAQAPSLEQIIRAYPRLAFERLPLVYYSPALWYSAEARAGFVPSDREGVRFGGELGEAQ